MNSSSDFSELRDLEGLYDQLEVRLEKQFRDSRAGPAAGLGNDDEGMEAFLERVLKCEARLKGLAQLWNAAATDPEGPERRAAAAQAARLADRAAALQGLIDRNVARWRDIQAAANGSLLEMRQGARLLQSMRQERSPRFLDATR